MSRLIIGLALLATMAGSPSTSAREGEPRGGPCAAAAAAAYERATGRVRSRRPRLRPRPRRPAPTWWSRSKRSSPASSRAASRTRPRRRRGQIPWVLTGAGAGADAQPSRGRRACGSWAVSSGGTRRQPRPPGAAPDRVERCASRSAVRKLAPGELALVPLSLAGPGPVAATDVPPLSAAPSASAGAPRRGRPRVPRFPGDGPGQRGVPLVRAGRSPMTRRRLARLAPASSRGLRADVDPSPPFPTLADARLLRRPPRPPTPRR